MKVKKSIEWCPKTENYFALLDLRIEEEDEDLPMVTDAIVFMICGVNEPFKIPIAYRFIKTLNAIDRAKLVEELIKEITKAKVTLSNLTFDGLAANAAMCESFGCNFKDEIKPFFLNPVNKRPIYIIFDPSHMLKLARNTLGQRGTLYDDKNHKIKWNYIVELEKASRGKLFGHTHKISQRHIQWESRPMHVRTAAGTLSNSTADALQFLMNSDVKKFSNASETIKFIRTINDIFDIMNSMRVDNNERNPFKNALHSGNHAKIFEFFENTKSYLISLKVMIPESRKIQKLIDSKVRTGFRGILVNIMSISLMYKDFVEKEHWLRFFATYRLSQDHLEMFFGRIRMANGLNDNPTCKQFISAYRKLSLQAVFDISKKANVSLREEGRCYSNILNVSSSKKIEKSPSQEHQELDPNMNAPATSHFTSHEIGDADVAGIVFIANKIEQKLLNSDQIHCVSCLDALVANDKVSHRMCVMTDRLKPCESTFRLCKIIEFVSQRFKKRTGELSAQFKSSVIDVVLNDIDIESLFPVGFDSSHEIEHKQFIIKFIMDSYLHIRNTHNARSMYLSTEKEYLRSKLKKNIHNIHQ